MNKQVRAVRKSQGKNFHKEIGSIGGNNTPTQFTSETGTIASNKRWQKYRQDQLNKRKELDGHQQTNGA